MDKKISRHIVRLRARREKLRAMRRKLRAAILKHNRDCYKSLPPHTVDSWRRGSLMLDY